MKFILTFIAGLVIGAGGLFAYLRQLPAGTPAMAIAGVSAAMAPGAPQVPVVELAAVTLPAAPAVTTNLTEADLAPPPSATIPATLPAVATAAKTPAKAPAGPR
jgi:hypothetical protein